ncbi:MAG: peptidase, partial [Bacteroidetes bacterium]
MRLRLSVLFLLIGFSGLFAQSDHLPGEMIVLLRPGVSPQALQRDFALQRDPLVLRYERLLSARMNIHLLRVEGDAAAEEKALSRIARHPQVILAQFNHRIETRETHQQPNDPGFAQQWALNNTGQTGGLADADVDAPEAWNITTGGVSSLGDTIVVAVIDEGIDIQHEDLDLWKNHAEIPGNGLDDDANGYTDDYQGWNAYSGNGSIPASYHGTHVAGIVAAIGNNGIGVSGINWHTKVMNIAGSSGNEAVVISAYGYVLEMRKRYNESDGLEGAFVVATNASFGVNYGNPVNYPIWCAIYDSLGAAGVLNVSATMNINANVDVSGDVPSTCASPYLLTVTNTTASDQKNGGAAYGLLSIDIGAPGTSIRSTLPGNTYGFETGTSMAAPLVAGTAALLVSAACPALMVRYRSDPAGTVLLLKQLIMNGSDAIPGLQGQVVSGRLNAYQSLLLLQDSCALIPANCLPPYQ